MGKNNFVSITLSNLHSSVTTLYSMLAIQFINNNNNDNKIIIMIKLNKYLLDFIFPYL